MSSAIHRRQKVSEQQTSTLLLLLLLLVRQVVGTPATTNTPSCEWDIQFILCTIVNLCAMITKINDHNVNKCLQCLSHPYILLLIICYSAFIYLLRMSHFNINK